MMPMVSAAREARYWQPVRESSDSCGSACMVARGDRMGWMNGPQARGVQQNEVYRRGGPPLLRALGTTKRHTGWLMWRFSFASCGFERTPRHPALVPQDHPYRNSRLGQPQVSLLIVPYGKAPTPVTSNIEANSRSPPCDSAHTAAVCPALRSS